jgi:hypothetical protein
MMAGLCSVSMPRATGRGAHAERATAAERGEGSPAQSTRAAAASRGLEARPRLPTPVAEVAPWEGEPRAPLPSHHVAAHLLNPIPPPAVRLPDPVPPANPALERLPIDNPGGVDGDRPPRSRAAPAS